MKSKEESIKSLLSSGDLEGALLQCALLFDSGDKDKLKSLHLLNNRYHNNEKNYTIKNVISLDDYLREKNKISDALLSLIYDNQVKGIVFASKYRFYLLISMIGMFIVLCVFLFNMASKQDYESNRVLMKTSPYSLTSVDSNRYDVINNNRLTAMDGFSVEYMRLYGAFSVPYLMDALADRGKPSEHAQFLEFEDSSIVRKIDRIHAVQNGWPSGVWYATPEFIEFWTDKWVYKDVRILKTKLWQECKGKYGTSLNLYFTAMPNTFEHYLRYLIWEGLGSEIYCDGCPEKLIDLIDSLSYEDIEAQTQNFNENDIGFLFLILKNENDARFHEISLEYIEYQNPLQIFVDNDDIESYNDFLEKKNPENIALSPKRLKNGITKEIKISNVRPNDTFLWLIAIYRSNRSNGLPEFYISNIIVPKKIYAVLNNDTCVQLIREPFGESSARILVPIGWQGQ